MQYDTFLPPDKLIATRKGSLTLYVVTLMDEFPGLKISNKLYPFFFLFSEKDEKMRNSTCLLIYGLEKNLQKVWFLLIISSSFCPVLFDAVNSFHFLSFITFYLWPLSVWQLLFQVYNGKRRELDMRNVTPSCLIHCTKINLYYKLSAIVPWSSVVHSKHFWNC